MDLTAIAQAAVELAQKITALTGDFEASGILSLVKEFLANFNVTALVEGILKIVG